MKAMAFIHHFDMLTLMLTIVLSLAMASLNRKAESHACRQGEMLFVYDGA